jgi:hypothetical protein
MIFKQAQEIIDGRKTQTRRLVKPGEYLTEESFRSSAPSVWCTTEKVHCIRSNYYSRTEFEDVETNTVRIKWQVGKTYAVQPKRGARGLLIAPDGRVVFDAQAEIKGINAQSGVIIDAEQQHRGAAQWLIDFADYRPLRIEITALWREHVQDISAEDACAEGIDQDVCLLSNNPTPEALDRVARKIAIERYRELWDSINTRKGTRWSDNPEVWVIEFKVVTP